MAFRNRDRLSGPPSEFVHFEDGDQLRTHRGYAELLLGPTTVLRIGGVSLAAFRSLEPGLFVVELLGGAVVLDLADTFGREKTVVVSRTSRIEIDKPGVYRVEATPEGARTVQVFQGRADVFLGEERTRVKKNQRLELRADAAPRRVADYQPDGLDLWAAKRRSRIVDELLAGMGEEPSAAAAGPNQLESLRAIRRGTEAAIEAGRNADKLWVK